MLKMKKKCYQTVNYFMKNLFGIDKSTLVFLPIHLIVTTGELIP